MASSMTTHTDLQLAIELQHKENVNFIALNALSPGRIEQIRAFEDDCQNARSTTTANELQEIFNDIRIQEYNDQNFARRLAVPPLPPLAPLEDHSFVRNTMSILSNESSLKSTGENMQPADFDQVKQLSSNFKELSLSSRYLNQSANSQYPLKSTGESFSPQFNKFIMNEDNRSLANYREAVDKLPKAFPQHMVRKECEVCQELVERYSLFPCGHNYCNMCITKVFKSAIGDRSLIPEKCCRVEIDQNLAEYVLETDDFNRFREILHEVETKEKMYW
jgi:hypothetical protein